MKALWIALTFALISGQAFATTKTADTAKAAEKLKVSPIVTLMGKLANKDIYLATPKAFDGGYNEYTVSVKVEKVQNSDLKAHHVEFVEATKALYWKVLREAGMKEFNDVLGESGFQGEIRSGRRELLDVMQDYLAKSIVDGPREEIVAQLNALKEYPYSVEMYQAAIWGDGAAELLGYEGTVLKLTDWETDTAYIITIYWYYCHC